MKTSFLATRPQAGPAASAPAEPRLCLFDDCLAPQDYE